MSIVANLMVADMDRALTFWRDLLGFEVKMAVDADRAVRTDGSADAAVFVMLAWQGAELMLQTRASLEADLPGVMAKGEAAPTSALYLRGYDPHGAADRLPADHIVKGPVQQWYGMTELYLRDPDGHLVCLGVSDGPPPS